MSDDARVTLPTGLRTDVEVATLASGHDVQICRTFVQRGSAPGRDVTLLLDMYGRALPTQADLTDLARTRPGDGLLAGVLSGRSGEVTAVVLPKDDACADDVAAAAAVCAVSWGWDESECIEVKINDRAWSIAPVFRDDTWVAHIRSEPLA